MSEPCFIRALAADEPLYGTMKPASWWVLLEQPKAWQREVVKHHAMPLLQACLAQADTRTFFIRQGAYLSRSDGLYQLYIAALSPHGSRLYAGGIPQVAWQSSHFELLKQDDETLSFNGYRLSAVTDPLYAVCTNSEHDTCCGTHGVPFYNWLRQATDYPVWQISHIGGHRFAATMICFPSGVCYGRLDPDDASTVIQHDLAGTLWLDKLRGRVFLPPAAQAAEYFLRQSLQIPHIAALSYLDTQTEGKQTRVRFEIAGTVHQLTIEETSLMARTNSHDSQSQPVPRFVRIDDSSTKGSPS